VVCAGVLVNPGDVIVASDEGVVVVPIGMAGKVASAAEEIQAAENHRREGIRSGKIPYDQLEEQLKAAGFSIR
jgi:4-hydroxy-4-methyl-2-oxoglutarate aldolase